MDGWTEQLESRESRWSEPVDAPVFTVRDWDDVTRDVDALLALAVRLRRIVALRDAEDLRDAVDQVATWAYDLNDAIERE